MYSPLRTYAHEHTQHIFVATPSRFCVFHLKCCIAVPNLACTVSCINLSQLVNKLYSHSSISVVIKWPRVSRPDHYLGTGMRRNALSGERSADANPKLRRYLARQQTAVAFGAAGGFGNRGRGRQALLQSLGPGGDHMSGLPPDPSTVPTSDPRGGHARSPPARRVSVSRPPVGLTVAAPPVRRGRRALLRPGTHPLPGVVDCRRLLARSMQSDGAESE